MSRHPRVALCAAITFDGKLDAAVPPPPVLLAFVAPADHDRLLPRTTRKSLTAIRALLVDGSIRRILCAGGPGLFRALLDAAMVTDLYLLVRPRVDGRRAAPTLSGPFTPEFFPRSIPCRLRRMEVVDGECLLHYTVARRTP